MNTTTVALILAAAAAYALAAAWAGRWLYAHWRAETINQYARLKPPANPAYDKPPSHRYEQEDHPRHAFYATAASTIWPITLPALLIDSALRHLLIKHLPLSPHDNQQETK